MQVCPPRPGCRSDANTVFSQRYAYRVHLAPACSVVERTQASSIPFTPADLKTRFPRTEVTTVIQCNGNRREDFHFLREGQPAFGAYAYAFAFMRPQLRPLLLSPFVPSGPPHWVSGAMGNSTWAGAPLREVSCINAHGEAYVYESIANTTRETDIPKLSQYRA